MCFANNILNGQNLAMQDVCLTPSAVGPVPVPYVNIASRSMSNPSTANMNVFYVGGAAASLNTLIMVSSGDEAGVSGGVSSGVFMGCCKHTMGSNCVTHKGFPATTSVHPTMHNGYSPNALGMSATPSQTKVSIMR